MIVNTDTISAGNDAHIFLRKAVKEVELTDIGDFEVIVDLDRYTVDPPADSFVRYFRPDIAGGPILNAPIEGVFGSNPQEIPSTYVFQLIQVGGDLDMQALVPDDCLDILIIELDVDQGGGGIVGPGDITANSSNGNLPIGTISSSFGDVTLTALGNIYDANNDTEVDVRGNNITLTSLNGDIGGERDDLEIDSAFSGPGALNASAAGAIYITEVAGPLRLGDITSGAGIVRINAVDGLLGDFDTDGDLDGDDVNAFVTEIVRGAHNPLFDTNGDGIVDRDDLHDWVLNLKGTLLGDANLDGIVDVSDFNRWNGNKFTSGAGWTGGDFNADGVTDVSDFNIWNANKFTTADATDILPYPKPLGREPITADQAARRHRERSRSDLIDEVMARAFRELVPPSEKKHEVEWSADREASRPYSLK